MDKTQFAKYIAENMNISTHQADIVIELFTSNLTGALFEGHSVGIDGFGAFIPTTKLKTHNKIKRKNYLQDSNYSTTNEIAFIVSKNLYNIA